MNIIKQVTGFQEKLNKMINGNKKELTRRKRFLVNGTSQGLQFISTGTGSFGGWVGDSHPNAQYQVIREESEGITFCATMRYKYVIPRELYTAHGQMKAALDMLGVSQNPAIAWNAIPFTFVIDWLVNFGGFLDSVKVDNIQLQTEITDFCMSAKVSRAIQLGMSELREMHSPTFGITRQYGPFRVVDRCVKSYYERRVGIPNIRSALAVSGLNMREFLLGGALAGSSTRRRWH
jgi:hypothetical protein